MLAIRLRNAISSSFVRLFSGRSFGALGKGSRIVRPVGIERADRIFIGDNVFVGPLTGLQVYHREKPGRLEIGAGCKIGRFNHIYAYGSVRLEPKVLTANGVYISDNSHAFENPDLAIMDQPIAPLSETVIGEGSWIGHNAVVFGARVGRQCVIAANAVVNRDIPDYCVVVGVNRIVRRLDPEGGIWRRTLEDGTFAD